MSSVSRAECAALVRGVADCIGLGIGCDPVLNAGRAAGGERAGGGGVGRRTGN